MALAEAQYQAEFVAWKLGKAWEFEMRVPEVVEHIARNLERLWWRFSQAEYQEMLM